jgi:hypothetical protein
MFFADCGNDTDVYILIDSFTTFSLYNLILNGQPQQVVHYRTHMCSIEFTVRLSESEPTWSIVDCVLQHSRQVPKPRYGTTLITPAVALLLCILTFFIQYASWYSFLSFIMICTQHNNEHSVKTQQRTSSHFPSWLHMIPPLTFRWSSCTSTGEEKLQEQYVDFKP